MALIILACLLCLCHFDVFGYLCMDILQNVHHPLHFCVQMTVGAVNILACNVIPESTFMLTSIGSLASRPYTIVNGVMPADACLLGRCAESVGEIILSQSSSSSVTFLRQSIIPRLNLSAGDGECRCEEELAEVGRLQAENRRRQPTIPSHAHRRRVSGRRRYFIRIKNGADYKLP